MGAKQNAEDTHGHTFTHACIHINPRPHVLPTSKYIHLTLMFGLKIQLPTYWYFTGIFKMQTWRVISQGSHRFLLMSQPRAPHPSRLFSTPRIITHRHVYPHTHSKPAVFSHTNTHTLHPCPWGLLINRQSVKIHSLKALKGFCTDTMIS